MNITFGGFFGLQLWTSSQGSWYETTREKFIGKVARGCLVNINIATYRLNRPRGLYRKSTINTLTLLLLLKNFSVQNKQFHIFLAGAKKNCIKTYFLRVKGRLELFCHKPQQYIFIPPQVLGQVLTLNRSVLLQTNSSHALYSSILLDDRCYLKIIARRRGLIRVFIICHP